MTGACKRANIEFVLTGGKSKPMGRVELNMEDAPLGRVSISELFRKRNSELLITNQIQYFFYFSLKASYIAHNED